MVDLLRRGAQWANAAEKARTTLAVNWPIVWSPAFRTLKRLMDENAIGEAWEVRWGNAPSFARLRMAAGIQESYRAFCRRRRRGRVVASGGDWRRRSANYVVRDEPIRDAADNAAIVVRFPSALSILKPSWSTVHNGARGCSRCREPNGQSWSRMARFSSTVSAAQRPRARSKRVRFYRRGGQRSRTSSCVISRPGRRCTRGLPINLATMAIVDAEIRYSHSGSAERVAGT